MNGLLVKKNSNSLVITGDSTDLQELNRLILKILKYQLLNKSIY